MNNLTGKQLTSLGVFMRIFAMSSRILSVIFIIWVATCLGPVLAGLILAVFVTAFHAQIINFYRLSRKAGV